MLSARHALVLIEDLHWADEATLDLLRYVGRRVGTTKSLVLATCRSDELGSTHPLRLVLGDLATTGLQRLAPQPLSLGAVRELAGERSAEAEALHRTTGGNPFFLTEVLAAGGGGVPVTVRDAVLARAARLRPSARAILDAVAVAGPRVEPWLLQELVAAESVAVEQCLDGVGGGLADRAAGRQRVVVGQQAGADRRLPEPLGAGALAQLLFGEHLAGRLERHAVDLRQGGGRVAAAHDARSGWLWPAGTFSRRERTS
jgi:hypothetical protein